MSIVLTVLSATRNGERALPRTLEAYCGLERPSHKWKIVVVDNGVVGRPLFQQNLGTSFFAAQQVAIGCSRNLFQDTAAAHGPLPALCRCGFASDQRTEHSQLLEHRRLLSGNAHWL